MYVSLFNEACQESFNVFVTKIRLSKSGNLFAIINLIEIYCFRDCYRVFHLSQYHKYFCVQLPNEFVIESI